LTIIGCGFQPEVLLFLPEPDPIHLALVVEQEVIEHTGVEMAARLAQQRFDETDGLWGRPIQIDLLREGPSEFGATSEWENASGVVGPIFDSRSLSAVADQAWRNRVPHVAGPWFSLTERVFNSTDVHQSSYLMGPPAAPSAPYETPPPFATFLRRAADDFGCTDLATLSTSDFAAQDLHPYLEQPAAAAGLPISASYERDEFLESPLLVQEIAEAGHDCVFLFLSADYAVPFLQSWGAFQPDSGVRFLAGDLLSGEWFRRQVNPPDPEDPDRPPTVDLDGMLILSMIHSQGSEFDRLTADVIANEGSVDPVQMGYIAYFYDSLVLLAMSIAQAGSTSGDELLDRFVPLTAPGATIHVTPRELSRALEGAASGEDIAYRGAVFGAEFGSATSNGGPGFPHDRVYHLLEYDAGTERYIDHGALQE
jgi:hypothetical protein